MADELQVNAGMAFTVGGRVIEFPYPGSMLITVSGTEYMMNAQLVGATEELLAMGDVAKGGYGVFYNPHATAVVQIRPATAETDLVRLEPADIAIFRIDDGATPYVISSVAGSALQYFLVDP